MCWAMINIAMVNAYIVWVTVQSPLPKNREQVSLKSFKVKLVHELCDGYISRKSGAKGKPAT